MRNVLALVIALGAIASLVPSVVVFFQQTQSAYGFDDRDVVGGAWLTLGRAFIGPISVFALAALVEMLFRISQRLPQPLAPSSREPTRGWPWRNPVANIFLAVAGAAYAISSWALYKFIAAGGAPGLEIPRQNEIEMTFSMIFYWLTAPLEIIAWAAVIEYISRIASALQHTTEADT